MHLTCHIYTHVSWFWSGSRLGRGRVFCLLDPQCLKQCLTHGSKIAAAGMSPRGRRPLVCSARMVLAEGPARLSQPRHRCPEAAALLTEQAWAILIPVHPRGATSDMERHQTQGQEVPGCQKELYSLTPHPKRWGGLSAAYISD